MDYDKIEIETIEEVYEPSEDSELAAEMISYCLENIKTAKDVAVLDMGTATGILGIFAASREEVGSVTLADINPKAVALAKKNAAKNRKEIKAMLAFIETDLFSKIPKNTLYDLIIFNAPYLRSERDPKLDDIRWSGGKEGVELSIDFLNGAVPHLKKEGKLIIVISSLSNVKMLKNRIEGLGLYVFKELKKHYFFEDILVWMVGKRENG